MWDFPRPPRVEPVARPLRVELAGHVVADTRRGLRVVETSQAPAYYLPPGDVDAGVLRPNRLVTACEWKGLASYLDLVVGDRVAEAAAWTYRAPRPGYEAIAGWLAFYPQRVDACWVGDELVAPNAGDFYGGWITADLVGPFKGGHGSAGW